MLVLFYVNRCNILIHLFFCGVILSWKINIITQKTTVSLLNYHFVFCPRYRRKIFLIDGVEARFKELASQICSEHEIEILAIECHKDHVHVFLSCQPKQSPSDVMNWIKGASSKVLRDEYKSLSAMPGLWTRNYFVSTASNVSSETIKQYVEIQKTRP